MAEYNDKAQSKLAPQQPLFVAATAGLKAAAKRVAGRGKGAKVKVR